MSVLFALLLASTPTTAPAATVEKKPRLKCEWIHEVGTSRPRRICEKRVQAKPAEQPKPAEQASDAQPAPDHSGHQPSANE
jgi:hypothetical protein